MVKKKSTTKKNNNNKKYKRIAKESVQNQLGYIEQLYRQGDYTHILEFLLEILPNTIVKVNYIKSRVEIYLNLSKSDSVNAKIIFIEDATNSIVEFKNRVNELMKKTSEEQKKYIDKYTYHNYGYEIGLAENDDLDINFNTEDDSIDMVNPFHSEYDKNIVPPSEDPDNEFDGCLNPNLRDCSKCAYALLGECKAYNQMLKEEKEAERKRRKNL